MHILIIEDEPDVRLEIKEFLQNSLYEVSMLEQFDHAAEDAVRLHPDLILLDLNLPGQSGFEVCSAIRTAADVPVIFVTGRSGAADAAGRILSVSDTVCGIDQRSYCDSKPVK